MRGIFLSVLLMFLWSETIGQKRFRKITKEETKLVKKYSKTINKKDGNYHILILTDQGDMVVKLYNETPLHRDNFVTKVKSGFYDSLMFHRVINNFMVQGGDPTSKKAQPQQALGSGLEPMWVSIINVAHWQRPEATIQKRQVVIASFILCNGLLGELHNWIARLCREALL
jgi:hypothetical protein